MRKARRIQRGSITGSAFIGGRFGEDGGIAALVVEQAHHVEGVSQGALGELSRQLQGARGAPAEKRAVVVLARGVFVIVHAGDDRAGPAGVG